MLSKSYEERLAARAKRYVDKLASRAHGNYKGSQRVGSSSSDTLGFRRGTPSIQFAEDGDQAKIEDPDDSPVSPFYCEEIFEEVSTSMPPFDNLQDTLAKNHFSPSPATSFSNEPSDVIVQDDSEACHDSKPLNAVRQQPSRELRRSSRLSRNHPGIYSDENIAAGPSVDPKNERDTRSKKPSISAIREVQALRLSGLGGAGRPYLSFADRNDIHQGFKIIRGKAGRYLSKEELELLEEAVLHVDFCLEEIRLIWVVIMEITNTKMLIGTDLKSQFMSIMVDQESNIPTISRAILDRARRRGQELGWQLLKKRDIAGICAFLQDAAAGYMTVKSQFLCLDLNNGLGASFAAPSISTLIRERETWGMAPFRVCQGKQTFNVDIANHIEDSFVRRSEWTDCCGDISAISWTGNHSFICGATAHSDYHNMQYNKPGNLLAGSTTLDTLRAVDAHRIRRPIISSAENAENALESMRQTQDPWLYTSVVSTSYSEVTDHTFTASFDGTVKVWKVSEDGFSMSLCGTWGHDGKVNFVVTSENHGLVATASDVSSNAIRVYKFDEHDIPGACYDTYSGDKAQEQARGLERRDTWAYFPATIQWGKAHAVAKLLLVGYSPRSSTGHEVDIPDEKKNSGELCIWNAEDGQRVQISSARTQNVFEVIWHPSQPIFLAATSPCGTFEPEVKTQIRLFALNKCGAFLHIKTLDCPALDINELTIQ
jgi:WD40 repeat protein